MAQIKISGLPAGTPNNNIEIPATNPNDLATPTGKTFKYYLTDLITFILNAQGFDTYSSCRVATTLPLTAVYANGALGVGATLTNSGAQTSLVIDGVTLAAGNRVLVKNQAASAENGIYVVSNVGSLSTNWVLTRATDFDQAAEIIYLGVVAVNEGSTNAGIIFQESSEGPFVMGTSAITFLPLQVSSVTQKQVQESAFNFAIAGGVNDAFTANLLPDATSYTDGLLVTLSTGALFNTVGNPTLNVNSLGAKTITFGGLQLEPGDIEANATYVLVFDLANNYFNIINPTISIANTRLIQFNDYRAAVDSGVINAYIANITPPISSLTGFLSVLCKIGVANTGASTLTVNGFTAPIVTANNQALTGGELIANQVALFLYDTSWASFILVNPSTSVKVKLPVTDDAVARFDGTTGTIQNSLVTIDDAGVMSGATQLNVDAVTIDGDTISTNTVNGNLYLEPNGTGHVDVGDPGLEVGNILIDGVAFNSRFRVNDIGNTAPAMVTIHKHSTTQEPLQIAARSNSNTSAHATVTANMPLYSMYATGWLNNYYGVFGQIRFSADSTGTLADGSAPGKLELMVTPDGAVIPVSALSISNAGVTTLANALPVGSGGSGRTTATAYAVICGGTTSTGAHQSVASVGTSGQVLTSNGAGALPTFQDSSGSASLTFMLMGG